MDDSADRKPLSEVQNLPTENRLPPSTAPTKTTTDGIKKSASLYNAASKRLVEKKSNIPRAPTLTRRQTASGVPPRKPDNDPAPAPVPSRINAAPKRAGHTRRNNTASAPVFDAARRRASTSITFTQGTDRLTPNLGKRNASMNQKKLEEINSKQDDIMRGISTLRSRRNAGEMDVGEIRLQFESMTNKLNSLQNERDQKLIQLAEDKIELKSKLLEAENQVTVSQQQLQFEQKRVVALENEIVDLKEKIAASENGKQVTLNGIQGVNENVENLQKKLHDAEERYSCLQIEKSKLQNELKSQFETCGGLETEVSSLTGKLKELQRLIDVSESESASKESKIRRMRKEKENAESERDELEISLKKKNASLQEQRALCEKLETEVEQLKNSQEDLRKGAEKKVDSVRTEAMLKVQTLEQELEECKRFGQTCSTELENRNQELVHMRETTALQESNMSRANCEKMNLEAKVEALHGEMQLKVREIESLLKQSKEQKEAINNLEEQAREDAALRRKLHNAIQELKGNIRVYCRVRPLLAHELESPAASVARELFEYNERGQGVIARAPGMKEAKNAPTYPFKFDRVFGPDSNQDAVFEEISQLVQSALDGYRVCIFAYGQTGSGKTHTMVGVKGEDDSQLGMIPRSVRQVFDTAKQLEKDQWSFKLKASFLEIYNETVRDLLDPSRSSTQKENGREPYRIVFSQDTKLSRVIDLTEEDVENEEQVQRLITKSMRNRATAATQANDRSSRSHSVFRLHIEGQNAATGQKTSGLLNLIDLAGSERLAQSKAEGERLRETRHINKSLSALGDVIAALANREKHVPFRNSKLTHLLQDSLGGDCKTLMFVNVSHAAESFSESLCSLRFAAKVNSCHVGTARRTARIEFP